MQHTNVETPQSSEWRWRGWHHGTNLSVRSRWFRSIPRGILNQGPVYSSATKCSVATKPKPTASHYHAQDRIPPRATKGTRGQQVQLCILDKRKSTSMTISLHSIFLSRSPLMVPSCHRTSRHRGGIAGTIPWRPSMVQASHTALKGRFVEYRIVPGVSLSTITHCGGPGRSSRARKVIFLYPHLNETSGPNKSSCLYDHVQVFELGNGSFQHTLYIMVGSRLILLNVQGFMKMLKHARPGDYSTAPQEKAARTEPSLNLEF